MLHTAAIVASLSSLGLICAIYYSNFLSRPDSWLRADISASLLISLFVGFFPIGVSASLVGIWKALTGGFSLSALMTAGSDVLSFAICIATVLVFREAVRRTYRQPEKPDNVTPFKSPVRNTRPAMRKAA